MESYDIKVRALTDNDLYETAKKYIIQENSGLLHNKNKCDIIYAECERRNIAAFSHALEDALVIINSSGMINNGLGIANVRRMELMPDSEVAELIREFGESAEAADDKVRVAELIEINKNNLVICEVTGQSMKDARIENGDRLLVDISITPDDGDIIVASVNDEMFVKRFRSIDNKIILASENEEFEPVKITGDMKFEIYGVVKHVIMSI